MVGTGFSPSVQSAFRLFSMHLFSSAFAFVNRISGMKKGACPQFSRRDLGGLILVTPE
jgi:hypothetical protein